MSSAMHRKEPHEHDQHRRHIARPHGERPAGARVEQIKKFTIIPGDWAPGGDELTPTMKLRRKPIQAKYQAQIEAIYSCRRQVPLP